MLNIVRLDRIQRPENPDFTEGFQTNYSTRPAGVTQMPISSEPKALSTLKISGLIACLLVACLILLIQLVYILSQPDPHSIHGTIACLGLLSLSLAGVVHMVLVSRRLKAQSDSQLEDVITLEQVGGFSRWTYEAASNSMQISECGYDMLGFERGSISTLQQFLDVVHPDDLSTVEKRFQRQYSDRVTVQYRLINPLQETVWIEVFSEPLQDRNGQIIGRYGVFRDISSIRFRETALSEARNKTEQALELARMVEWEYDPDNRKFKIMENLGARLFMQPGKFTYSAEEFLARIDSDSRPFFIELLGNRSGKRDQPFTREVRFTRLDGEVFYLRMFGSSMVEEGLICRRFGLLQDITELRQAEHALAESEKEKNLVIDTIDIGLALLFPDHEIIWTNHALNRMFNVTGNNLEGENFCFALWDNADKPCDDCPVQACIQSRQTESKEFTVEDRFLSISAAPFIDQYNEITRVILMVRDITAQQDLMQQLLHAQKMEAVGQMAGGIAHDFNNILHIILGYCEFAQESCDHETQELLRPIDESAHKGHELVRQLLNFSHTETNFNPKHLDLNRTLPMFKEWIKRMIGENIVVDLFINDPLPGINADINQLDQVMLNLCVNARDAMPDGGLLTIDATVKAIDRPLIYHNQQLKPGDYVVIAVKDTGCGIQSEALSRIFDPFFTTKDIGKGTGLGLSTVYSVMQKHHGLVQVTSKSGCGTTFELFFPIPSEDDLDTADIVISINMDISSVPLTILFVEDDPMVRRMTSKTLEKAGFNLLVASDGQSAIDVFTENADTIDVVLLDVVLPRKSGREVFEFIRETRPNLPVVFATGYAAEYLDGIPGDANILQKPYSKKELLKTLKQLTRGWGNSKNKHNP